MSGKVEKCVLCKEPAEQSRPWDAVWNNQCAASICKLMELDRENLGFLFENPNYCSTCLKFVREIDFTVRVRTLTSVEAEKRKELRTVMSKMLFRDSDLRRSSGHDENEIDSSLTQGSEDCKLGADL